LPVDLLEAAGLGEPEHHKVDPVVHDIGRADGTAARDDGRVQDRGAVLRPLEEPQVVRFVAGRDADQRARVIRATEPERGDVALLNDREGRRRARNSGGSVDRVTREDHPHCSSV